MIEDQRKAWSFYGSPYLTDNDHRPVGEVAYVVGWIANQLSRLDWRVKIDGKDTWAVQTPEGVPIRSSGKQDRTDSDNHPVNASRRLLRLVNWTDSVVKQVATNLFVAGECHYCLIDGTWTVVSVIRPKRKELLERSTITQHALWPHPADPEMPDAPIVHALPILEDLDWLTRLASSQSASRLGQRGIVGISDEMQVAGNGSFWEELHEATQKNMETPDNLAPVVVRGPSELVKPEGNGMAGLSWMIPNFPYDDKVDERIEKATNRLAYSLPIPPEILKGLQAQSRATAFQVEDSAYRAHIEPPAEMIASVAAGSLSSLLDLGGQVLTVEADPSRLLARLHTVQDVLEAFDRGAVTLSFLRSALGIPEHAKPDDGESGAGETSAPAPDPADKAAEDPFPSQMDERVKRLLVMQGASQQACDRARERVGAKARTHESIRAELASEVPNQLVTAALGLDRLDGVIPVVDVVDHALQPLLQAYPELGPVMRDHVLATLEAEESLPLPDAVLQEVVA